MARCSKEYRSVFLVSTAPRSGLWLLAGGRQFLAARFSDPNQRINEQNAGLRPARETTRSGWFSSGSVAPLILRATLLVMEGLSNGGRMFVYFRFIRSDRLIGYIVTYGR
jgi:hypothetical protein